MSALTAFERRQLRALCDAIVPPGGTIPEGALDAQVPERIEEWLARFSPSWLCLWASCQLWMTCWLWVML